MKISPIFIEKNIQKSEKSVDKFSYFDKMSAL